MAPKKKQKGLAASTETKDGFEETAVKDGLTPDDLKKPSGIPKKSDEEKAKEAKESEQDLKDEIDSNFKLAYNSAREWIEAAKEDVEFKTGTQWTAEEKAILSSQGRPAMTFNKIKAIVELLQGHFIQNSNRIQVAPEGGEDQKFSAVSDRIMDHLDEQSSLDFNLGYQFAGGETTGRTFMELLLNYEKDPIFGELKSIYHGKPGVIFPDPRGSSYDLNEDREFVFKVVKKTKSWLKKNYQNKTEEIDAITTDSENPNIDTLGVEGDQNNYGVDKGRSQTGINRSAFSDADTKLSLRQWHVKEYWRNKYVDKWFVYFVDKGDMPKFDSEAEANAEIQKRKAAYLAEGGDEAMWRPVIRKRKRNEMWVAIRCGGAILADGKSPFEPHYSGFPFFQFIAKWTPEAEKDVDIMQGIVRSLKDPQREKNKARSQFLHIINTAANSGWIIDEDALSPEQKTQLKTFGSTPGIIIQKKQGREVNRIEPVAAPMAQSIREKAADDDFKEVSGVNADLLAVDESSNPSGRAIALRIRQAITILEPDFRNFRYTKKLLGTAIMKMVPTLFDESKLKKVLGSEFMKTNGIWDPEKNEADNVYLKSFLIQIEDLKYNVRIAEQGDTKTLREETFENLLSMLEKGVQLPFEVLAEFMNIPNKQELLKKVTAFQQQQAANAMAAAQAKKNGAGAPAPA